MSHYRTIGCFGKGGTGKTVLSALLGRVALEKQLRVLFIDADPVEGLACALKMRGHPTIASAREEIIQTTRAGGEHISDEELSEKIEYIIAQTLVERPGWAFLAMGQSSSLGCYCSINKLLKHSFVHLGTAFDLVIIDAEAGIEQINRQVAGNLDFAFILSDGSARSFEACRLVKESIARVPTMYTTKLYLALNRLNDPNAELMKDAQSLNISVAGHIPFDESILQSDRRGDSLMELDSSSKGLSAARALFDSIL